MWNSLCGQVTPRAGLPVWESTTSNGSSCIANGWETENQSRFQYVNRPGQVTPRSSMLITNLDSRRHNPHPGLAQHLDQLHGKKPVCAVRTLLPEPSPRYKMDATSYQATFDHKTSQSPRILFHRTDFEKQATGIVPRNDLPQNNIREEIILPVHLSTDTSETASVSSPHKYIQRKRKVPVPFKDEGVFYGITESAIPPIRVYKKPEKVGLANLCGHEFSRRKYVSPPQSIFNVKSFDGAAPKIDGDKELSPFVRTRNII